MKNRTISKAMSIKKKKISVSFQHKKKHKKLIINLCFDNIDSNKIITLRLFEYTQTARFFPLFCVL